MLNAERPSRASCLVMAIRLGRVEVNVRWRKPVSLLLARAVRDATVLTGLDAMTLPVLQRLARAGRPGRIIVIEPDASHPMLDEARATGARVVIGDPASSRVLQPVLAGWRGCAPQYLYALRPDVGQNEAVLAAAQTILRRYRPDPHRQPHLITRIDDPRHADHWRGWHCGTSDQWSEDALSAQEATACALADEIFRTGARQLLLCGDSTLALAILLELARRWWEHRGLTEAAAFGRGADPDAAGPGHDGQHAPPPPSPEQVVLLDQRSEDLRRDYLATSAHAAAGMPPAVTAQPGPWKDRLLASLDAMAPSDASATAVVIAGTPSEGGMHEAGRVARLHPRIPVFVLTSGRTGGSDPIFDLLRPFQRTLLVDGQAPQSTWTRVARHWHDCFRLRHPPEPGQPPSAARRPWAELDELTRQADVLQLRSVMSAVVARGRRWVPRRAVAPGSFIELSDRDLEEIARAVSARMAPGPGPPAGYRAENAEYLRCLLAHLEGAGFMPVVPEGGPPEAAEFERTGIVRAKQLQAPRRWTRRSGDRLRGGPGDWCVIDDGDDERTVRDLEFRASHEPLGGGLWRRTGTFSAWRVSERLVLRTMEGQAIAQAGDWVVEGHRGARWPVTDEQFRRTYKVKHDENGAAGTR
jgi:hypothetical protein